ncbi:MAG: serine/threonine protein kinase [Trichlorobacter sp.]|uniref:serine/threonine-protein kinase n=1 Tax=Trichlorobacter sp. TaxID=2911007 RepID=UPI00255EA17E|nr:serine/threonine-protein kinase [Trichlorobacter sp.]MDK9718653.1 serine/threonine protein kinase [Trichlorobacter sp.]
MSELPQRYIPLGGSDSGGFSTVIYCTDTHLDRKVAIKFIQDEAEQKLILKELSALLKMRSKHVVQVYDIVTDEKDALGIVEEYIEGDSLWDSDCPAQSQEAYLKTLWQVAAGIADMHEAGVIHRDIKPNNMKLDPEGVVKIFDFGLAKQCGIDAHTKGFKGTLGFAAPELFNDATIAISPAIDTYAFGATALFLACKNLPAKMKMMPPLPITDDKFSGLPVEIHTELKSLLNACLSYKPKERPSMVTVRDELARHLLGWKHQALAVYQGKSYLLNVRNPSVELNATGVGKVEILYTGLKFIVSVAVGEVFINNSPAIPGEEIPGSCVVALGAAHHGSSRVYITFDIANPEVVL